MPGSECYAAAGRLSMHCDATATTAAAAAAAVGGAAGSSSWTACCIPAGAVTAAASSPCRIASLSAAVTSFLPAAACTAAALFAAAAATAAVTVADACYVMLQPDDVIQPSCYCLHDLAVAGRNNTSSPSQGSSASNHNADRSAASAPYSCSSGEAGVQADMHQQLRAAAAFDETCCICISEAPCSIPLGSTAQTSRSV